MKLEIYSIRDAVAEVFNKPFTQINVASAQRAFTLSLANEPQKQDYTLYKVGEFDQHKGNILTYEQPIQIMTGFEIKTTEDNQNGNG